MKAESTVSSKRFYNFTVIVVGIFLTLFGFLYSQNSRLTKLEEMAANQAVLLQEIKQMLSAAPPTGAKVAPELEPAAPPAP
jgi:sulfite exporter TauE/SafE